MTLNVPNNRKHVTFFFRDYSGFLVLYLGCEQHEVEFLTGESSNTTNTSEGRHIRSCAEYEVLRTQMQPSPSHRVTLQGHGFAPALYVTPHKGELMFICSH